MKLLSVLSVNILYILGIFYIKVAKGVEFLCNANAAGKCSSIVEKSMQEKRPLSKGEYAYLVVKFENIVDSSSIINDNPTQENNPSQEQEQQPDPDNTPSDNNKLNDPISENNSDPDSNPPQEQEQQPDPDDAPSDNNKLNDPISENNSDPSSTPSPENQNQGRDYLLNSLFNIDGDNEKESISYTTLINTDSEPTDLPTENSHTSDLFLEDGEYGDDECDDDCNDIKEEKETVVKNSDAFTNTTKSSNVKRSLIRKNEVIAEQRFAQFYVPINEYSVLKVKTNSRNWGTEYIYVGLVHNKKVYYTHIPLRWATEKGCIEDRSVTIVLEDGNYKSIEWGYTSCKAKSCKHGCLHDERNDENNEYKRCVNQDFDNNKCQINIYVGWAGTDKDGYVMLDSAQSIYEIKNTF